MMGECFKQLYPLKADLHLRGAEVDHEYADYILEAFLYHLERQLLN